MLLGFWIDLTQDSEENYLRIPKEIHSDSNSLFLYIRNPSENPKGIILWFQTKFFWEFKRDSSGITKLILLRFQKEVFWKPQGSPTAIPKRIHLGFRKKSFWNTERNPSEIQKLLNQRFQAGWSFCDSKTYSHTVILLLWFLSKSF